MQAPVGIMGICDFVVSAGPVTVTVTDDVLGPIYFFYEAYDYGARGCQVAGSATGSVTVEIPPGCHHLDVFVGLAATTGIISVG